MALPALNRNHSAFKSMFEREKHSGTNFNDWFRSLKLVLRVEKKLFVIEQHLPAAPAADFKAQVLAQWNAVYDAYNEEEGKPVGPYVIKMKNYVAQLERLGYVLLQDLSVGLILNSLTSKGKGKGKGKDKPVYILKPKNTKPSAKEHPTKDDAYHHCKEVGHWKRNYPVYLAELIKKKKQVGTASSSVSKNNVLYFNTIPSDNIYEIDMLKLVPNVFKNEVGNQLGKTIKELQSDRGGEYIQKEELYFVRHGLIYDGSYNSAIVLLGLCSRDCYTHSQYGSKQEGYLKKIMGYYFYFPPENKIVVARYAEFLEKNLLSQEVSGRAKELEEIQDKDTSKGYTQTYRVDYEETISPVADIRAIRILIAIAAF
ncbi:hypothetical protein Tco_0997537 [Tanacetum coccineum]